MNEKRRRVSLLRHHFRHSHQISSIKDLAAAVRLARDDTSTACEVLAIFKYGAVLPLWTIGTRFRQVRLLHSKSRMSELSHSLIKKFTVSDLIHRNVPAAQQVFPSDIECL